MGMDREDYERQMQNERDAVQERIAESLEKINLHLEEITSLLEDINYREKARDESQR